jgi:hypothetical protein
MGHKVARYIRIHQAYLVPSGFGEASRDSQGPNLRMAPRKHHFAADTILELPFALDHEHFGTPLRHVDSQSCPAEAAAGDGQIVRCRHAFSSQGIS